MRRLIACLMGMVLAVGMVPAEAFAQMAASLDLQVGSASMELHLARPTGSSAEGREIDLQAGSMSSALFPMQTMEGAGQAPHPARVTERAEGRELALQTESVSGRELACVATGAERAQRLTAATVAELVEAARAATAEMQVGDLVGAAPSNVPNTVHVKQFGAVGDGVHDVREVQHLGVRRGAVQHGGAERRGEGRGAVPRGGC